jgi:sigma-B regulation protein RsbU (phosphoserine phosphatase)
MSDSNLAPLPSSPLGLFRHIYEDLEAAREIQSRLLVCRQPHIEGLDYFGDCRPVAEIGGDFFDFLPLPAGGLAVTVGDVSGHGIGSAILMSGLRAFLRGLTARGCGEIAGVVEELNRALHQTSPDNFYATLFYAHFDPLRRQLHYVSAGHEPAMLLRKRTGCIHRLESTGTVLGLTDRSRFGRRTMSIEAGDVLVAYTDGITDATDAEGREWTEAGIRQVLECHPGARASDLVGLIMEEVDRFAGHSGPVDDRTVAAVRFTGMLERAIPEEDSIELAFAAA